MQFNKLLFGTAGIPINTPKKTDFRTNDGLDYLKQLKLDAMELEFVRSVNLTKEKAEIVKERAKKNNIILTCHAPYYINLNATDKKILKESKQRIINAAEIADVAGAFSLTFHAGYFLNMQSQIVYENIKKEIKDIQNTLKNNNISIQLRPETTGKPTQFGSLKELIKLSQDIENLYPCIDFAHLHARNNGKNNNEEGYRQIMQCLESELGREFLNQMHIHMSGIAYSDKGEKHHLVLKESDLKTQVILKVWKDFRIKGVVISESPNIEEDAVYMRDLYENV